jgi:hypothetical protein
MFRLLYFEAFKKIINFSNAYFHYITRDTEVLISKRNVEKIRYRPINKASLSTADSTASFDGRRDHDCSNSWQWIGGEESSLWRS